MRLVFDYRSVSICEAYDLPKKLLIHLPKDASGKHGELIGTIRIVKLALNRLQRSIVKSQGKCKLIWRFGAIMLLVKMKKA